MLLPPLWVDMEPPDAWAEMRRAPRLLVLALLLGAHPGMPGWEQGARGPPRGLKGKGTFTHPRKPNLGDPRKEGYGSMRGVRPRERSGDSQAEALGTPEQWSETTREVRAPPTPTPELGPQPLSPPPLDLGPRPPAPSGPEVQAPGGWHGFLPGPRRPQPRALLPERVSSFERTGIL